MLQGYGSLMGGYFGFGMSGGFVIMALILVVAGFGLISIIKRANRK